MTNELVPDIDAINEPYWKALRNGALHFQECTHCGHRWLPARDLCPACLKGESLWKPASGKATIKSWVVYHVAFHPAFKDRLPYNVTLVELAEGPRLLTNIVGENVSLVAEAAVRLAIDVNLSVPLATFVLADA
ncbi:OB-fold domain-containing protein [Alcaligenaceae bacterium]|nr:OB-fold domain-containing protein [Alcaligenaceae bacterium]